MRRRIARALTRLARTLVRPVRRRAGPNAAGSSLLGPSGRDPLAEFDRLPAPLRQWLAEAAMPWSPRSALRIWRRVLRRCGGDEVMARREMSRIEAERLAQDVRRVWGPSHPYLDLHVPRGAGGPSPLSPRGDARRKARRASPPGRP